VALLDNPRHEAFARGIFEGKSQEKAYIDAGYSPNGARGASTKLLQANASINERVAELNRKVEASAVWGKVDILNRLASLHDRFAVNEDAPSGSVARAALMDYAKLNGLVVDKAQTSGDINMEIAITRKIVKE